MMYQRSKIEQEVDEIRLAIYERTKDLTKEELNAYYFEIGKRSAEQYGFKIYKQ
jgi:hypothetical protein